MDTVTIGRGAPPQDPNRTRRSWPPALAAVAAALLAAVVLALNLPGDEPASAPPAPEQAGIVETTPTTAPAIPYVLDERLYVDGVQVPGDWATVESGPDGWLAWQQHRALLSWWWGRGPEPNLIESLADAAPAISPNGRYVGTILDTGDLSGFDTDPAGEGFGTVPVDVGGSHDIRPAVRVRAVTDDGRVVAQGRDTAVLWLPLVDGSTVDLTRTAPGQVVQDNTPAGLVVTDGEDGAPYLATISDAGELSRLTWLPEHHQLRVNPGGSWLAYTPLGTEGGEVEAVGSLEVAAVGAGEGFSLSAPDGWDFRLRSWAWEDDDHLVSAVVGGQADRMARCSVPLRRCVLIEAP